MSGGAEWWYVCLEQAMGLMLPKNVPRRQIPDAYTLESKMDCMKITSSYSCAALSNVHLDAILDDIKCNLRKEQRTVMELNYMTMHKVLTPIQASCIPYSQELACKLFFVHSAVKYTPLSAILCFMLALSIC